MAYYVYPYTQREASLARKQPRASIHWSSANTRKRKHESKVGSLELLKTFKPLKIAQR